MSWLPTTTHTSGTYPNPSLQGYPGGNVQTQQLFDPLAEGPHPHRIATQQRFRVDSIGLVQGSHEHLQIQAYTWQHPTMEIGRWKDFH